MFGFKNTLPEFVPMAGASSAHSGSSPAASSPAIPSPAAISLSSPKVQHQDSFLPENTQTPMHHDNSLHSSQGGMGIPPAFAAPQQQLMDMVDDGDSTGSPASNSNDSTYAGPGPIRNGRPRHDSVDSAYGHPSQKKGKPCIHCSECEKTFSRKHDLLRHEVRMHGKVSSPSLLLYFHIFFTVQLLICVF